MHDDRASLTPSRKLVTQLARRVCAQGGDTLIEVLVGAILLAIGVIGGLTAYDSTTRASARQNQYLQEETLAHQDQEQMRAVPISQYATLPSTETVQGVEYNINRTYAYESLNGGSVCNANGSVAYLKTTSAVTPDDPNNRSRDAQQLHIVAVTDSSFVSAPSTVSLIAHVGTVDETPWTTATGTANVVVAATPSAGGSPATATTDAYGCAVFSNLAAGDYNVSVGPTSGYVTDHPNVAGNAFDTSYQQPVQVVTGTVASTGFIYAPGDSVLASFVSNGQPAAGDSLVINNSAAEITEPIAPGTNTSWTNAATPTEQPTITATGLFPFALYAGAAGGTADQVYAGTCLSDDPQSVGYAVNDTPVSLYDGVSTPADVQLQVPPLNVQIYAGTSGTTPLALRPSTVLVKDTGCNYVRGYSGTGVLASPSATGVLAVPSLPMGNYIVCVEATSNPGGVANGAMYVAQSASVTSNQVGGVTVPVYWGTAKLRPGGVGSGCV